MKYIQPRVPNIQPIISNSLILIIVAVLFSTFFIANHQLEYSIRRGHNVDDREAAISGITEGSFERRISMISLGAFWGLLIFRRRRFFFKIRGALYWLVFLYIFWAVISIFWADDFQLVTRRVVVLIILCISAFSTSINVPLRRLASVIFWTCLLFLITGIYSEIVAGTFSLSFVEYRFSGTCHPESQGVNCAMLFFAAIIMSKSESRLARRLYGTVIIMAFFFLLLTRSRGPFVAAIIAFVVYKFYSTERSKFLSYLYIGLLVFFSVVLVLGDSLLPFLESGILLGRQEERIIQLNGRLALWGECVDYAKERPLIGYGFQGFWTEDRVRAISDSQGWILHSSHSIYMENVLNLGSVGLVVFLLMMAVAWSTALRTWLRGRNLGMIFALSLLTLWLADGLLSGLFGGLGFVTYLVFVVLFSIARESVLLGNRGQLSEDSAGRKSIG